jgi:rhamnosyl/mannosyltransferase
VAHLHACAVFAFPSVARSEAFGISIMEAHACGKAVVATRLGTGVEYINEEGKTGYNVPPGDAVALAEALNRLLADPVLCRDMGAYAQQRIETEFRAEMTARKEFDLYQEVLECSNTPT